MLLAWMAYAVLFGTLVYAAALAAERIAAVWRSGQRFVWVAALVVAAVVPVMFATRPRVAAPSVPAASAAPTEDVVVGPFTAASSAPARASARERVARIAGEADAYVVWAWLLVSVAWMAVLVRAAINVRRRRAHWRNVEIGGTTVLVSPSVGPAVVGALAPRVVIPHWALSLDDSARTLMLRHEAEHIRARDPLLLVAAMIATTLFPWNAALWLVVRRLRLAIEIDCDQRVLRAFAQQREYGELLLTVGARHSAPLPFATSLAERRPFLERRIRAMTTSTPRHPRLVSAACVALVAAVTTAAVRAPRPSSLVAAPAPIAAPQSPRSEALVPPSPVVRADESTPVTTKQPPATPQVKAPLVVGPAPVRRGPDSLTVEEIRAFIAAHHPSALTGDPDINTITLVVDARGNYVVSLAESRPFDIVLGGGRGRGGGLGRVIGDGGAPSGVYARGGAGGMGAVQQDSAAAKERLGVLAAKLAAMSGDTMVVLKDHFDATQEQMAKIKIALDSAKVAAAAGGVNMPALSRLIDPETIDAIRSQTFKEGQLGPSALRVIVVRQKQ